MRNEQDDVGSLVKAGARRYAAPPDLGPSISAALARTLEPRRPTRGQWWPAWLALGAVCGILVSVLAMQFMPAGHDGLADEVAAAHVRSLMVAHLEDVVSTDQHTVKPWFAGKLDFSPPVSDFSARGYALSGGRLDYIDRHTVASLVYRHQRHAINVFVWPVQGGEAAVPRLASRDGFHLIAWTRAGMQFWAVSDLNAVELQQFTDLLRGETAP